MGCEKGVYTIVEYINYAIKVAHINFLYAKIAISLTLLHPKNRKLIILQ